MASPMRGYPTARLQEEGAEEPERDPQQEDQPDPTEGKDIVNYDPDIDYEWSETKNEPVAQDQKGIDPDPEYAKEWKFPMMEPSARG